MNDPFLIETENKNTALIAQQEPQIEMVPKNTAATLSLLDKINQLDSAINKMALTFCKAGLYGFEKPEQASSAIILSIMTGQSLPQMLQENHIIKGKQALKSEAMLARFERAGGTYEWLDQGQSGQKASIKLMLKVKELISTFTIDDAKRAGLVKPDSNWLKWPGPMLRARAISAGMRMFCPAIVCGVYTPEEVSDMTEMPQIHSQPAFTPADTTIEISSETVTDAKPVTPATLPPLLPL